MTATVNVLQASKAGELTVVTRGHGQDRVRMTIKNNSTRRLNVIIPPGLVAASKAAQGPGGAGGGRGGGMQSIGLGSVTNREGAFGEFQGEAVRRAAVRPAGLRSEHSLRGRPPWRDDRGFRPRCLPQLRLPAPSGRNTLTLMDVDNYTSDPRVRKALRSLATLGTSQGVAQAVMWRICNDLPFEVMMEQTVGKVMNVHEIVLAARFVEALDDSNGTELVEPTTLSESRIFVQVQGEGTLAGDARRLQGQLDGLRVMGLPLRVVETETLPVSSAPALALKVILTEAKTGETRGRIVVTACASPTPGPPSGRWRSGTIPRSPCWMARPSPEPSIAPWPPPLSPSSRRGAPG